MKLKRAKGRMEIESARWEAKGKLGKGRGPG